MPKKLPRARKSKPITKIGRLKAYDDAHPNASAAEATRALGFTKQQVWAMRNQLKRKAKPKERGFSRVNLIQMILSVGIGRVQETLDFMTGER